MRWWLQSSDYDYDIAYRAGQEHLNGNCLSHIKPNPTSTITDFEEFRVAENKPIVNSKILDIIRKGVERENIIILISTDKIITHPTVRDIVNNLDLNSIKFTDNNQFYTIKSEPYLFVFYCFNRTHITPLRAEVIYQATKSIKMFCILNANKFFFYG